MQIFRNYIDYIYIKLHDSQQITDVIIVWKIQRQPFSRILGKKFRKKFFVIGFYCVFSLCF